MGDVIQLFEKIAEGLSGGSVLLLLAVIRFVLLYELAKHFLPKFVSWCLSFFKGIVVAGRLGRSMETKIRGFVRNSADTNWVSSISSLAKYHSNVGLGKIFHPLCLHRTSSGSTARLE